ncbi:unnamed protein product [Owenia fusiformis]|uniref:Uncharacterized protein n=1 Tax=Owenia fusiformis TaxID=6347 RepID=A0A8J1U9P4_OWEFU|nr:unnamed protein product [Owenia fusiformis]
MATNAAQFLMQENVWYDKWRCEDAEKAYQEKLAGAHSGLVVQGSQSSIVNEIARARQQIQNSLSNSGQGLAVGVGVDNSEVINRLNNVEQENQALRQVAADLRSLIGALTSRVAALESASGTKPPAVAAPKAAAPSKADEDDDSDDDIDLFGSDESEDEELEAKKADLVKKYQEKKGKKPALIAKSNIILDVKPWDDETDMAEMEKLVRSVQKDGLLWGASKLLPVGYGIKKLQIAAVVEDDKVGTDFLEENICAFEDFVQSVDVAAFQKI